MIGSSMGACAALKFGIEFNCKAIISICPHIDLDICAEKQGRFEHVKFVLKDGNPYSQDNFPVTRRIRDLVHNRTIEGRKLPMLFMHSCKDDHGVHVEQVLPLVEAWHKAKSVVFFDERPYGGHGSDFCTKAMIVDLLRSLFEAKPIHVSKYRRERFLPPNERFYYRVSRKLKSGVKRPIKLILKNLGLWQA
ncbi:MAG: hypothetical protein EB120_03860 [Proteobacteria bacterium]|nr:hypothetical protein [Pseudomonadota bacterium]